MRSIFSASSVTAILALGASAQLLALGACARAATDVATPAACAPATNERLAQLIAEQHAGTVDNVMVCGTTIGPSRPQRRGRRGSHQLIPLRVPLAAGGR